MKTNFDLSQLAWRLVASAFLSLPTMAFGALPNAWQITDNSSSTIGASYSANLPALTNGWRYSLNARLLEDFNGSATMVFLYGVGTNRFSIYLDLDANNDLTARPFNQPTLTLTTNGHGAVLYHAYDIVYDPATRLATFLFDGVPRTTWDGDGVNDANGHVMWGSGSSAGQGNMAVHSAAFYVGTNVVAYDAGVQGHPAVAPDPVSQGWTATGASAATTNAISPDNTSLPSPLVATTLAAANVQPHTANLSGSVNLGGLAALAWIEWGTSTNYGNATPQFLKADSSSVGLSLNLTGLRARTTYHFRCGATNRLGETYGQDLKFTTPPTLVVRTLADSGPDSLRQAITDAAEGDTITFSTSGTIFLTSGQFNVSNSITLVGPGAPHLRIEGSGDSRIFRIVSGTTNTFSGITIANGRAPDGLDGGGIHNAGKLSLYYCVITGNRAGDGVDGASRDDAVGDPGGVGGEGGGIYNAGTLELFACTVTDNRAGTGGRGGNGASAFGIVKPGGIGGDGGGGGGVYNAGNLAVVACTVTNNIAGTGGTGGTGGAGVLLRHAETGGAGGTGGSGGGIMAQGAFECVGSIISFNQSGRGGRGGDGGGLFASATGGNGGSGSGGGRGAGCYMDAPATFTRCDLQGNRTGDGGSGGKGGTGSPEGSPGGVGDQGDGGGIFTWGNSTLRECTLSFNQALSGGGSRFISYSTTLSSVTLDDCWLNANSAVYDGGAMLVDGTAVIQRSTLTDNTATNGGGIHAGEGSLRLENSTLTGNRGGDRGGAIAAHNFSSLTLVNCSVVSNSSPSGGGIHVFLGTFGLTNSIVALNGPTNFIGSIQGSFNITNGNPLLAPLGDYGGPTPTMPPLPGSPAIDTGLNSVTNFLATDQRGYRRRSGTQVDIGAVEWQQADPSNPPLLGRPVNQPNGSMQFNFTNDPAIDFSVYASTNVAAPFNQWLRLGTAAQPSPGQYQFTDSTATNYTHRFYKVVWP